MDEKEPALLGQLCIEHSWDAATELNNPLPGSTTSPLLRNIVWHPRSLENLLVLWRAQFTDTLVDLSGTPTL